MMSSKNVAIIGAGPGGLSAAKYALENGLTPFVYDKAAEIGGLWSSGTAMWDDLHANASRYILTYADHPWPKESSIFPSKKEVQNYLISYADRFNLNKHIYLNRTIKRSSKLDEDGKMTRWELEFENGETKVFNFLSIASGLHSKPNIPQFKNLDVFEGITLHSSQFKLNHSKLKDKKVIVIGCCYSGSDISANLVGHASEVVNVFSRPYLVSPRLVPTKLDNDKYSILPIDFVDYNRKLVYIEKDASLTDEEKKNFVKNYLKNLCPLQTRRDQIHPSLFIDLDDEKIQPPPEVVISISDTYIEHVVAGKIKPIKSSIKEVTKDGLILTDGSFESADAILFATGYDCSSINYLDDSVIDVFRVKTDYLKFQYALGLFTFHPDLDNFALIGQLEGLYYNGAELQGKLVSLVFR
jgi:dimethylaniline monooxygenase (N-oxide forming)